MLYLRGRRGGVASAAAVPRRPPGSTLHCIRRHQQKTAQNSGAAGQPTQHNIHIQFYHFFIQSSGAAYDKYKENFRLL